MASTDETKFAFSDVARLVEYDSETGALRWSITHPKVSKQGLQICSKSHGYIVFRLLGGHAAGHRVAWLLHYGHWPSRQIDHINGDRSDNRIINLRDVTPFANARNRDGVEVGRMVGAVPSESGWSAVVLKYATPTQVGSFPTAKEASDAAHAHQQTIEKPMRPRPKVRPLPDRGKK